MASFSVDSAQVRRQAALGKIEPPSPDERLARQVLLVPRLLAHEHQLSSRRSLAENGLGGVLPEVAGLAGGGGLSEVRDLATLGNRRAPSHKVIVAM